MSIPRIGITSDFETITDRRGAPSPRYVCSQSYVSAVVAAGGQAVLLPHEGPVLESLDDLDGLLITGGDFDVPPSYYGETPRKGLGTLIEARSAIERDLCRAALDRKMPLLGICGGMQMLNVVCGGTLYQDLSEREGTDEHQQAHDKRQPAHSVDLAAGSVLARLFESDSLTVNSTHHQVIRDLGKGLIASAVAPDGVVEGIELTEGFAIGVQWHPEAILDRSHLPIYRAFVDAAR
ncbi:MAG: gamma-glutamyl-gamma-aminobutyrate hydrolase family protein [Myxococcota bacterium]